MIEKVYTMQEAAAVSGFEYATIRQYVQRGDVLTRCFKDKIFIEHEDLMNLLWAKCPLRARELQEKEYD